MLPDGIPLYTLRGKTMTGLECLAIAIYFEARSEPKESQLAVAETIYNRMIDPRYPDSICSVVWQRKQFSFTHDGKSDKPKNKQKYKEILEYSREIMKGELFVGHGATHYHADYVAPSWSKELTQVGKYGRHIFYRWEKR